MKENKEIKSQTEKLQDIVNKLKELNFNKYSDKSFKIHEKICKSNDVLDVIKNLTPIEKLILFYENQLENILIYRSLFPVPEAEAVIKKLMKQAQDFYKGVLEPVLYQNQEIKEKEFEKIKKLEEFMKDIEIDLDD